jgi:hypothetical protein
MSNEENITIDGKRLSEVIKHKGTVFGELPKDVKTLIQTSTSDGLLIYEKGKWRKPISAEKQAIREGKLTDVAVWSTDIDRLYNMKSGLKQLCWVFDPKNDIVTGKTKEVLWSEAFKKAKADLKIAYINGYKPDEMYPYITSSTEYAQAVPLTQEELNEYFINNHNN